MKNIKIRHILLLFVLAFALFMLISCYDSNKPTKGIVYDLNGDGTCAVIGYEGTSKNIVIAKEYAGLPVSVVYDGAFKNTDITSVKIPDSVTSISWSAFQNCKKLERVVIGNGVTNIDDNAFYGYDSLRSITIGDGVTNIGDFAFKNCGKLKDVYLGKSVATIGDSAFEKCENLEKINLPESLVTVGSKAFEGCASLLRESNNIYYIGDTANPYTILIGAINKNYNSYEINKATKFISSDAFSGCGRLASILIPDSVIEIGFSAFKNCNVLADITLPFAGATNDGMKNTHFGYIFGASSDNNSCVPDSLKRVTITNASKISDYTFRNCYNLVSIEILGDMTDIGEWAFYGCYNLTKIALPTSVKSIGDNAFRNCYLLGQITLPDNLVMIGKYAFDGCSNLKSIRIPKSVKIIGSYAFSRCNSLNEVEFENSVGWSISFYKGSPNSNSMPESDLFDKGKAAEYITDTYKGYCWER